ncbi:MAG: SMP-30/gluconolactonase/LRE family protein [Gammaproteobacteria bacterium]
MRTRISSAITLLSLTALSATVFAQREPGDIRIDDTAVFPESVTSSADGTIYIGSVKGNVYRTLPDDNVAHAWIRHSPENGILTILGVLADDAHDTLWLCSAPNFFGPERSEGVTALHAYDLQSGTQKGKWDFPGGGTCNDITIAADGTAFASDTAGGRILTLAPGANELTVWGSDPALVGIDGLAFTEGGALIVNNVRSNELIRVDRNPDGTMGTLTSLMLNLELGGPDGIRLVSGNRFIQAEGTVGRIHLADIDGDRATITVLDDSLISSPGVTVVGNTAYAIESNIQYLLDPNLRGQEPEMFSLKAIRLPQ